ncbi:hypothetical protein NQ314_011583 [Rhamnusium bicolor]|uniref:Putative nuclease HARBI1 n=1 Tax=Rhamnusium bicolor TaxID=1586634 RepID=A0AAV8XI07_9CUCU|nr:hypothetical protein NQ314_011583 [Rhamnusium bicolor]
MAGINDLVHYNAINVIREAVVLAHRRYRRYPFNDAFEDSDEQFVKLYRLPKPLVQELIDNLDPYLIFPTRVSALNITRKVLCALRFFASESYQWDIAKHMNHAISQTSVSKTIQEVIGALNRPELVNRYVHLPRNMAELVQLREKFYRRHKFPGIIGCVDCTHVAIYPPQVDEEVAYVNRKGYHSINVQLICDLDLRILNVGTRYPGSSHDSYIWNNSALHHIQNLHRNGHTSFAFLGDSGYALRPWMLTPVANAQPGTPEELYNQRQSSTRSIIERCNGVLKLRFRCLLKHRVLQYTPQTSCKIINSCVILHNMCIQNGIAPIELGYDPEDQYVNIDYGIYPEVAEINDNYCRAGNPELVAGRRIQQLIIRNHFYRN